MHEVSIMQGALALAEKHARAEACTSIELIRLRVGALSGVVTEALEFAFEALKGGTLARNGRLEIEMVQPVSHCSDCDREFSPDDICYACPECGRLSPKLVRGMELELAQLEAS